MKINLLYILLLFSLIQSSNIVFSQNKFNRGINLTDWFQKSDVNQIQFKKYTKQDFHNVKSLGCDVIRLPISLENMTNGSPKYNIDPISFTFLDSAANWAEDLELSLILDNHTFEPGDKTDPNLEESLIPIWQNMAEHFKNRSNKIFYEIYNEPHGISNLEWNEIQRKTISAIREIDSIHTIIIGASNFNSYEDLEEMPFYEDPNLIYTFHFYSPFLFTHQGAAWTTPSMEPLAEIPFPYSLNEMPSFPSELSGTWLQNSFNNFSKDGTIGEVKRLIDIAAKFKEERNVEVYCGEYGVLMTNSNNSDRVEWYRIVREYLEEKNISWTIWDYQGGFGIFNKYSNDLFNYDLNLSLVDALGLNNIIQEQLFVTPDTSGFSIYEDYIGNGIKEASYSPNATINYYDNSEIEGQYSIYWANADQFEFLEFDFIPNKDFSILFEKNANLHISLKSNSPDLNFDIRFIDSISEVPDDKPWRMRYKINESTGGPWNNTWREVVIPLSEFKEHGAYLNNEWYNPIGAFDWSKIDVFNIVAEDESLIGKELWIDNIYISINLENSENKKVNYDYKLDQNYPNPFNSTTTINYSITSFEDKYKPINKNVSIKIFDILGQEQSTIVDQIKSQGNYKAIFNGKNLPSGIYYYQIIIDNIIQTKKMLLVK